MRLHTDDDHPHVHVVVKAVSERGERLNIRKATLREWRRQFAANLRELSIAANATERAVRGETKTHKSDGIFRAAERNSSTHMHDRQQQMLRELARGTLATEEGNARLKVTRMEVVDGWRRVAAQLATSGDRDLVTRIHSFVAGMPPPQTDKELMIDQLRSLVRTRHIDPTHRTR
jgi:hypothetical protein